MAFKVFKNPASVTYDSTAAAGCTSISYSETAQAVGALADNGDFTAYVTKGFVTGTLTFTDPIEANKVNNQSAASKNLTIAVTDEVEGSYTITITGIKTGGMANQFATNSPSSSSVNFVAASVSDPTGS